MASAPRTSSSLTRSSSCRTTRSRASSRCSSAAMATSTAASGSPRSATPRSASGSRETFSTCCLRFGISSCIRTLKRKVYDGTGQGRSRGSDHRSAIARPVRDDHSRSSARKSKLGEVLDRLIAARRRPTSTLLRSRFGSNVLAAKGERSWADVSEAAGYPRNHNWHVGKRGPLAASPRSDWPTSSRRRNSRSSPTPTSGGTRSPRSRRSARRRRTTSTVPDHHNFVADDVIVHNSTLVCDFAQNVTLKHQKPVALFSLEMSEMELAHRFIGSQSRISSDRLRKGKVSTKDWPKVVQGLQPARVGAALDRRLLRPRPARAASQGSAAARAGAGAAATRDSGWSSSTTCS